MLHTVGISMSFHNTSEVFNSYIDYLLMLLKETDELPVPGKTCTKVLFKRLDKFIVCLFSAPLMLTKSSNKLFIPYSNNITVLLQGLNNACISAVFSITTLLRGGEQLPM